MNPGIGRFMGMDTDEGEADDPLSLHKYVLVADNPVNKIDPSGNDTMDSEPIVFWHSLVPESNSFAWMRYFGQEVIWYQGAPGDESHPIDHFRATSGLPGHQTTSKSDQRFYDPNDQGGRLIPAGRYAINLIPDPNRVAQVDKSTGDFIRMELLAAELNKSRRRLLCQTVMYTPMKIGVLFVPVLISTLGRILKVGVAFTFHDSSKGYTHGCVETEGRLFWQYLLPYRSGHPNIEFRVNYVGTSTGGY